MALGMPWAGSSTDLRAPEAGVHLLGRDNKVARRRLLLLTLGSRWHDVHVHRRLLIQARRIAKGVLCQAFQMTRQVQTKVVQTKVVSLAFS